MPFKDLTGQRFGRLLAIKREPKVAGKATKWLCTCDCGNKTSVFINGLSTGHTKSCGCLQKDVAANMKRTHGLSHTPTFKIWAAIRSRCLGNHHANYKSRGITMCDRWLNSFEAFLEDMGTRPKGKSIDRIDVNGNYTLDNCRWATNKEQCRNMRKNVFVTHEDKTLCIAEWAERLKVNPRTLYLRKSRGWSDEDIITTPVLGHRDSQLQRR